MIDLFGPKRMTFRFMPTGDSERLQQTAGLALDAMTIFEMCFMQFRY
jgi:hypothetical protein